MEELKIGADVLVKAKVIQIIFDEKGKHYKIIINNDRYNATTIDPKDIVE